MEKKKIYFREGDTVVLKQDISNKPIMLVKNIDKALHKEGERVTGSYLFGIRCIWFNTKMELQQGLFSSKDLEHYG